MLRMEDFEKCFLKAAPLKILGIEQFHKTQIIIFGGIQIKMLDNKSYHWLAETH